LELAGGEGQLSFEPKAKETADQAAGVYAEERRREGMRCLGLGLFFLLFFFFVEGH
jgi:hypothetical protein